MSLPTLQWKSQGNEVSFDDESERTPPVNAIASVTLSGGDTDWGEFLTRDEATALHAWLGVLLEKTAA